MRLFITKVFLRDYFHTLFHFEMLSSCLKQQTAPTKEEGIQGGNSCAATHISRCFWDVWQRFILTEDDLSCLLTHMWRWSGVYCSVSGCCYTRNALLHHLLLLLSFTTSYTYLLCWMYNSQYLPLSVYTCDARMKCFERQMCSQQFAIGQSGLFKLVATIKMRAN